MNSDKIAKPKAGVRNKPAEGEEHLVSAALLTGGISSIRSTLGLVLEQARQLLAQGLISADEVRRLEKISEEVEDLALEYHNGMFLSGLNKAIKNLRRS